jgi:hypothetical protein
MKIFTFKQRPTKIDLDSYVEDGFGSRWGQFEIRDGLVYQTWVVRPGCADSGLIGVTEEKYLEG